MIKNIIFLFLLSFLIYGCGPKGTTTTSNSNIGYIYDSAIYNIDYYTCGNRSKISHTEKDGSFRYIKNCEIDFKIGKIILGNIDSDKIRSLKRDGKIFITDILGLETNSTDNKNVKQMARLLVSLDADKNPENGITISNESKELLDSPNINFIDFRTEIKDEELVEVLTTVVPNNIVTEAYAVSHFERTLDKEANIIVDNSRPDSPVLIDQFSNEPISLTEIKEQGIKKYSIRLKGEPNTSIHIGILNENNEIIYTNMNSTINKDGYCDTYLDFSETKNVYKFFIKLIDLSGKSSEPLVLDINKDHIPPYSINSSVELTINEETQLLHDLHVFDDIGIANFFIVPTSENNYSVDANYFSLIGQQLNFKNLPSYEESLDNNKTEYNLIVRFEDTAGNNTEIPINIKLRNILDNPPAITDNNLSFSFFENMIVNGLEVYNLSNLLETNLTKAPDNNPSLSPIYYNLESHTDILTIDRNTGIITILDQNNDLFDFEKNPNPINVIFSVENNNTNVNNPINKTYGTITLNIKNVIDTKPELFDGPYNISIPEHEIAYQNIDKTVFDINILDYNSSDKNTTVTYDIVSGNDGNWEINNNGEIIRKNDNLDWETNNTYSLVVRASNTWWDNTTHFDEETFNITVTNVIDNPPIIKVNTKIESINEATNLNFEIASLDTNGTTLDETTIDHYELIVYPEEYYTLPATTQPLTIYPFSITNNGKLLLSLDQNGNNLSHFYNENISNDKITRYKIKIKGINNNWNNTIGYSNTIDIDLNVTNVIDNPPIITSNSNLFFIDEDSNIGTTIETFTPNGTIYDENNVTDYRIISGNDNNIFTIIQNGSNGVLKLNKNNTSPIPNLDWETQEEYNLKIVAVNNNYNNIEQYSDPININININNSIEKKPIIKCVNSPLEIPENIDYNQIIALIQSEFDINNKNTYDSSYIDTFNLVTPNKHLDITKNNTYYKDFNNTSVSIGELRINSIKDSGPRSNIYYDEINSSNNEFNITYNATNSIGTSNDCNLTIKIKNNINTNTPLLNFIVNFADLNSQVTTTELENNILYPINDYFLNISKNKFKYNIVGTYNINVSDNHPKDSKSDLETAIKNAFLEADSIIDFSIYDTNGDHHITNNELQIAFFLAEDQNHSLTFLDFGNNLNSHEGTFSKQYTLDGVTIGDNDNFNRNSEYLVLGLMDDNNETISIGLGAKYLALNTFGFEKSSTVNLFSIYDLMGDGYKGHIDTQKEGSVPAQPSAYNKAKEGFIFPIELNKGIYGDIYTDFNNKGLSLYNSSKKEFFNVYKIKDKDFSENGVYYLIENRHTLVDKDNGTFTPPINPDDSLQFLDNNFKEGGIFIWRIEPGYLVELISIIKYNSNDIKEFDNPTFSINMIEEPLVDKTARIVLEVKH